MSHSMCLGKWKKVNCFEEVGERGIFETASGGYVFADDTGYFSVGDAREQSMDSSLSAHVHHYVVQITLQSISLPR